MDELQVSPETTTKKNMPQDQAVLFSYLFSVLASSGVAKGDNEKLQSVIIKTFNDTLDGFGYRIVPK